MMDYTFQFAPQEFQIIAFGLSKLSGEQLSEFFTTMSPSQLEVVMRGLGKLPGEQMFTLLCKIIAQKDAQDKEQSKSA